MLNTPPISRNRMTTQRVTAASCEVRTLTGVFGLLLCSVRALLCSACRPAVAAGWTTRVAARAVSEISLHGATLGAIADSAVSRLTDCSDSCGNIRQDSFNHTARGVSATFVVIMTASGGVRLRLHSTSSGGVPLSACTTAAGVPPPRSCPHPFASQQALLRVARLSCIPAPPHLPGVPGAASSSPSATASGTTSGSSPSPALGSGNPPSSKSSGSSTSLVRLGPMMTDVRRV